MMKIIGGALLCFAGAALGMGKLSRMRRRERLLSALDSALARMSGEICLLLRSLPDVFSMLAETGPEETKGFFTLLSLDCREKGGTGAWGYAVDKLELEEREKRILSSLAPVLGQYEAARQSGEIEAVRRALASSADALRREMESRGKSYAGLGLCLGAIAAIILI